jgi:asparagine synthase (glutamine-hydrolysing)
MCGIFGILDTKERLDTKKHSIPNSTEILKHRGPDNFGHFLDSNVYLGHRRLSIIDLDTGDQPIFNEDRSKCIIFNGEIYNFKDIRNELEYKGHIFTTDSDTEVIIHAYEEWGVDCLEKLRGMFAFAIWDTLQKKLFLARDRLGIKPLFYAFHENVFYFASEMKAILQNKSFPREIDYDGLISYFQLSYIPAPVTIFKHIFKLPAGHSILVSDGNIEIRKYWDLEFAPDYSRSENYFIECILGYLEETIKMRMISDVPIGAFLSGGIDSSTVVAFMSKLSHEPVRTFCIGFGGNIGGYLDERKYARKISSTLGCNHREYEVTPDVHSIINEIVFSFDEPFADPSTIPSYYVCKKTREDVTVSLSGLGGDELFGGYERYLGFKLSNFYNRLPYTLKERIIRSLIESIPERRDGHYTINHLKRFVRSASLPDDMRYMGFLTMLGNKKYNSIFSSPEKYTENFENSQNLVLSHFNSKNAEEPLDRVFYCDIKTYLPEDILACTDRMSMLHSLEVRVPFIDHKFLEFCVTIPHNMKVKIWDKKHILKKAVQTLVPKEVVGHRKQGFVGPMASWLKNDLKPIILEKLSKRNLSKHGIFDNKVVKNILDDHFNNTEINDKLIWAIFMFQNWYDFYIENEI